MNNFFQKINKSNLTMFSVLFFTSYLFSILLRLIWVYQFQGIEVFTWNEQLMINTNDGYYFAEGARDILAGLHQANDLSPINYPLSQLTAFLVEILPFSFESIILYMPSFMGSLLVAGVLLMGFCINERMVGFIGALSAGIVWSYYNRTMTGYYDTDMLTVVLPTFILSSMIFAATHQKNRYLLMIPLMIMANQWWYHASASINLAFFIIMFLYTVVFERKNSYFYKILLFMAISLIGTYFIVKIGIVLALFLWFHFKQVNDIKIIITLFALSVIVIIFTGGMSSVLQQFQAYIFRSETMESQTVLHFFNVAQTVREAGIIPFETFANRISGHSLLFIFSLIGYMLLLVRHKVMLLTLPLVGLGFIAYVGGLRFTVYAVPVMSLSIAYLIMQGSQYLQNTLSRYFFIGIATIAILTPNISHIIGYRVPTVFQLNEVELLTQLKSKVSREDYILTWWDYGYPIRYYTDVKTLVDGGKHNGDVNFPVSYALMKPPLESAMMARLNVEYTELAYQQNRSGSYIQMIMQDYNFTQSSELFDALSVGDLRLPAKTRDIYYYLPLRMMDIFPTISLFSNMDLSTGIQNGAPLFYQTSQVTDTQTSMDLGRGIIFDKVKGVVKINNQDIPLGSFITTAYDQRGKLNIYKKQIHSNSGLAIIYMKDYNRVLVVDEIAYNSTYVQLFVLEKYDKSLFEEVMVTPRVKIFRLLK